MLSCTDGMLNDAIVRLLPEMHFLLPKRLCKRHFVGARKFTCLDFQYLVFKKSHKEGDSGVTF